jgi:uncharacterized protein with HEPN domain
VSRDIRHYLVDIIENIGDAERFIAGMSYEQFITNKMVVNAVIRSIEIIGEAAKHIPSEIRVVGADIPWKEMSGMRDKCIHDYVAVDFDVVWTAVKKELPQILKKVEILLKSMGKQDSK